MDAREAVEEKPGARQDSRSGAWFSSRRRARTPYVPHSFPVEYGKRSYSPVSKYPDGVRAGDYVTYFDEAQALRDHRDPCQSGSNYARSILYRRFPTA